MIRIDWDRLAADTHARIDDHRATQADAAIMLGLAQSTINRLLQGKPISADTYAAVCVWLDVPMEDYLTTKPEKGKQ